MKKTMLSNEFIAELCSELQYQFHAGIGNADALSNICEDMPAGYYKEILQSMAAKADEGKNLSEIFKETQQMPEYPGNMLEAGEKTGHIEEALEAIATASENRASLDRKMKSALLYPAVLMLIMLLVIMILLIYVMPVFNEVYAQLGGELTGVAGVLLNVGKVLGSISPVLIALFIAVVVFLALFAMLGSFREKVLNLWWKRKGTKGVSGKIMRARFSQVLSMCMSSGLPVDEAIEEASKMLTEFPSAVEGSKKCLEMLQEGSELSAALGESGILPKSQCRILEAGIRGGSGEQAIKQVSSRMTEEGDAAIEESVGKIEPAIVIISSILVGIILLAVMLPLINIMGAIG